MGHNRIPVSIMVFRHAYAIAFYIEKFLLYAVKLNAYIAQLQSDREAFRIYTAIP